MSTDVDQLATQLSGSLGGRAAALPWLWPALLRALARAAPVTLDELAAATGHNLAEVRAGLGALTDTEYDAYGRVVGHGITVNPTPHSFEVDGHRLYTWCALDTLIFPAVLDRAARVSSPCHATGTPIHLDVDPQRVASIEPAAAVVSILTPDGVTSVRSAFCNQVHFFASATAAEPWLREHPDASVLPVREAFDLGRRLTATLLVGVGTSYC
ncbi:organomercurial lyase MerB [Pseudonocardia sp. GCM10023141]|uniref:organomercurial lyase MerB n=1 Tax=Pseudonocardia sp. GCM10023141 TaxID=3252653 RepID=UPI00362163C3